MKTFFAIVVFLGGCSWSAQLDTSVVSRTPDIKVRVSKQEWSVGKFQGLEIGRSTRADVLEVLGLPTSSRKDDVETVYEFSFDREFKGIIKAYISEKTNKLSSVEVFPTRLTFDRFVKLYGSDYQRTRYRFVSCPENDALDGAPITEADDGELEFIEYRDKGMVVSLTFDGKNVRSIEFVSGARESTCPK